MFPIHVNLGFRIFPYYEGLYFLLAILAATLVAARMVRRAGLEVRPFLDSLTWILLGAIFGARVFHFMLWDGASLRTDPWAILRFWEGGLSITGGLVGGVLSAWLVFRRQGLPFAAYVAAASPAVLLGQALGRIGCFLNGDAWGMPTRLPWGLPMAKFGTLIPGFHRDSRFPSAAWEWSVRKGFNQPSDPATVPLHPTQLYEALGDLLLAALVLRNVKTLARKGAESAQPVVWLHLAGYSFLRFMLEYLRGDGVDPVWAGMTMVQIVMLALAVVGAVLYGLKANPFRETSF